MELELAIGWVIFSFLGWIRGVHPGGNAEDFENKRVAGKAIRKTMKTKGPQMRPANERTFRDRAGEHELQVEQRLWRKK